MGSKSKQPAARLGDIASNHGPWPPTPIIAGAGTVTINGIPAARKGDAVLLHAIPNNPPHARSIAEGASSVLIEGKPAARVSDAISCGGKVATGSGNVLIGDSPKLLKPASVNIPDLNIPDIVFAKRSGDIAEYKAPTPTQTTELQASAAVRYTPPPTAPVDAPETPDALSANKQSAVDYWNQQKDSADNFPEYLAAHLMGLNAETGYSIVEGLQATYEIVTDKDKFLATMDAVKDSLIDTVTDPVGAFNSIKQAAIEFSELPLSEQGETAYKAMMGLLAGGGASKTAGALGKVAKANKSNKDGDTDNSVNENTIRNKKFEPGSLSEAQARLSQRRDQIKTEGYKPKYADDELVHLAQHGNIGNERFQVRFMETKYLVDLKNAPNTHLSGAMGGSLQTVTGKGAKYWSTSFDQMEDADTDPQLIALKLGLDYNPKEDYALIIVDTEKAAPLTGVKSVPATFEKVGEFANTELPDDFPKSFTDTAMTPEFQSEYSKQYEAAVTSGLLPDGSRDVKKFEDYLKTTDMKQTDIEDMKLRMKMHGSIGNNQHYLGTGLTKDLYPNSPNNNGAVETLNFERKEVNLSQLSNANAITILPGLRTI